MFVEVGYKREMWRLGAKAESEIKVLRLAVENRY